MPIIYLAVVILIGAVVAYTWFKQQLITKDLLQRGVTVTATITHREKVVTQLTGKNGTPERSETYYVTYRYEVNGSALLGRAAVPPETYDILIEGATTDVVYVPDKPSEVRLVSSFSSNLDDERQAEMRD